MAIKFEEGDNYAIPKDALVKIKEYSNGDIDVKYITKKSKNISQFRRLNKYEYIDMETGEIREYNLTDIKSDANIRRTMNKKVRPILENSFFGGRNELFISLTFSQDMQNFNELPNYFNNFWKRLTRKYKNKYNLACLYVKEMQSKRCCWHYHLMLKEVNGKYLIIDTDTLYKIWKYGSITVSRIWGGNDYIYREINEEKRLNDDFFLMKQDHNVKNVISYMCKMKSKSGFIPASGKLYGLKGKDFLKEPAEREDIYGNFYSSIEDTHVIANEKTLLLIDEKTNNIINNIHTQKLIKQNKKK